MSILGCQIWEIKFCLEITLENNNKIKVTLGLMGLKFNAHKSVIIDTKTCKLIISMYVVNDDDNNNTKSLLRLKYISL